ncbi:4'-phosphopantetheinyl transferase family protein [uncultured Porphyromonas sp.]|uniref:4'-phosphopantetheinyl transferase family protein n=1 Tax=uncultured Porphyromonas sp. TaxID=159274 RepID=UPI0026353C0D|nr:4'-phosphopantetheinyl transferase family protein [uncultured Porphyromonas sp.]
MTGRSSVVVVPRLDRNEDTHLTLKRGLRRIFTEEDLPHVAHFSDGAPYFPDRPDLLYSSSDCHSSVALQVAPIGSLPVGIDVEDKADQAARILPRYATEEELEVMVRFPEITPLRLWSAKEAVFKAFSRYVRDFRRDITLIGPGRFVVSRLGEVSVSYRSGSELSALSESHHTYPDSLVLAFATSPEAEVRLIVL